MFEKHPQGEALAKTFAKLNAQAVDRRGFLTGAGKLAGAGAFAMALTGTQLGSVFANHAGTEGPDTQDGNVDMPDPNNPDAAQYDTDVYDFNNDEAINELDVLQFAHFLEHLENAFYAEGLATFTAADFQRGLRVFRGANETNGGSLATSGVLFVDGALVYDAVVRVGEHEAAHAADLGAALAANAVEPCEYDFSAAMGSVEAFMRTAQVLENYGVAAYVGAASGITTLAFIRIAASIATVEARHAAYFDLLTANAAHPSAYDLARPMGATFDLVAASGFVLSCPNPGLLDGDDDAPPANGEGA